LINATGKRRKYFIRSLNLSNEVLPKTGVILKNDTLKLGNYIEAQFYTHPKERYQIEIHGVKKERIKLFWEEPKQDGIINRKYHVIAVFLK
jgi:hypothetical protein